MHTPFGPSWKNLIFPKKSMFNYLIFFYNFAGKFPYFQRTVIYFPI